MAGLPRNVEERIRRQPPAGVPVVPGSTPVISFGDFRKAMVATLGWNPSKNEFLDRSGRELDGDDRRLESHTSIGRSLLHDPRLNAAKIILDGCNGYFQRNPYHWFNKLELVLDGISASYWDGTACHLDLVQWATDPVWRGLSDREQKALLDSDAPFLSEQLAHSRIRLLLLNGRGIVNGVAERLGVRLRSVGRQSGHRAEFFTGEAQSGLHIIGWSTNLQSSRGVSHQEIRQISKRVSYLSTET